MAAPGTLAPAPAPGAPAVVPANATPVNARGRQEAPLVTPNPFVQGSEEHVEPFFDQSFVIGANVTQVSPIDIPAYGYLRHVLILVEATGGAGGAAVVARRTTAPWIALTDLILTDVGGDPINGIVNGYELLLQNRWGAYAFETDLEQSPSFSQVVEGSGASGNFSFLLRVPVEIAGRDALGALPNLHSASAYKLSFSINNSNGIYSVAPATTLPTVRVRCFLESWSQPPATDIRGVPNITVPPAMGTTQYWSRQSYNVNAGDQRIRLNRVGNLIRTLVAVFTNTSDGIRSTTNFPDPLRVELDGNTVHNIARPVLRHYMRERYSQAFDAYDDGVFVFDFTHDLDYKPGNEERRLWLPTTQASRLELAGSFGAAGTLTVLTNEVAPGGDVYAG